VCVSVCVSWVMLASFFCYSGGYVTLFLSNFIKVLVLKSREKAQRSQLECSLRQTKEPVSCRHIPASSSWLIAIVCALSVCALN